MELSMPAQAQPWTPSCRGRKRKHRLEPDTMVSSRNLLYSSSVIDRWGSLFQELSRNAEANRKLPLKSHCSKWSAQMPRWDSCIRQPALHPSALAWTHGQGWVYMSLAIYWLTATEPSEHFVNAANLNKKKKKIKKISLIFIFTFSFQVLLKPLMLNWPRGGALLLPLLQWQLLKWHLQ